MRFINWIHHLLNPHCEQCLTEKRATLIQSIEQTAEDNVCQSCEILKVQLGIANHEKDQMLQTILSFSRPQLEEASLPGGKIPFSKLGAIPWSVRRQTLEEEDRVRARLMREAKVDQMKSTNDLEKELGINE